ncbi:MAG: hypothetical protein ACQEXJ_00610 [Myxococcota bacterium]
MKTFAHSIVLALLTLGLVACGGGDKERKEETTQPQMSDAEALVGTWGAEDQRLTFTQDGTYQWEATRPCAAPPCPKQVEEGTWQLRHGKLYLDPMEGDDRVLDYSISWEPRKILLSEGNKNWGYTYEQ